MSLQQELLIELLQEVNRGLGEQRRKICAKHKLPVTTMIVVRHIKKEPGITISELARRTGIAKSHISNIIEEFSQRGWVEKRNDPGDQRLLRLFLSTVAMEQVELVRADIKKHISGLVSNISETRKAELIEGLREIKAALEQAKEREQKQ
jgi:DNA-binding MarR family transcriptional regulator